MKKLILSLAILGVAAANASAQQDFATAGADANATIVTAIAITKNTDMNFGKIVASVGTATPVELSTAGVRSSTLKFGNLNGTVSAATFTVTGEPDATYAIALPSTMTITGAGAPMTVDSFVSSPDAAGLLTLGTESLAVGATLHVGAAQVRGDYTGSFDVTVTYN